MRLAQRDSGIVSVGGISIGKEFLDFPAQELAQFVVGQLRYEIDPVGDARRAQPPADQRLELGFVRLLVAFTYDHGNAHRFAPLYRRHRASAGIGHRRVSQQHVFDLAWRHSLAPTDNYVIGAAREEEVTILVHIAGIACREPSLRIERAALLVLAGNLLAAHVYLAGFARLEDLPIFAADLDVD